MSVSNLEVVKVSDYIGAEIRGVDLTRQTPELHAELRRALAQNGVIFLRDQHITPDQHAELAFGFGQPLDRHDPKTAIKGFSYMAEVGKDEGEVNNIGGVWHIDQTYMAEPPTATILVAREVPERGGDTLFASMAAAYDELSPGMRKVLDGLKGVHSNEPVVLRAKRLQSRDVLPETVHPVIVVNPITGRKSIYISAGYTIRFDEWTEAESKALIGYLLQHGQRPEFQCRFKWEEGSIAIWDNTQVWHYATNDYQGRRRFLDRITVRGYPIKGCEA